MGGVTHEEFAQTKRGISERTEEKKRERGKEGEIEGGIEGEKRKGEKEERGGEEWQLCGALKEEASTTLSFQPP